MHKSEDISVLIVEDDPLVSEMVEGLLREQGYRISGKAADGEQAVELTEKLRPDIILMDLEMPRLNGLEATRQIYHTCPTPVVILTAYETSTLVEQAGQVGAGAYLLKPPSAHEIDRAITIAISRFEDMMALRRLNEELVANNEKLQAALDKAKLLSGMLPICANCKKIRDDDGYWQDVAVYIRDHSAAEFSHGICPDCMQKLYPGLEHQSVEQDAQLQPIRTALNTLGWATLSEIASANNLNETAISSGLHTMIQMGQVKQLVIAEEIYYRLV